MSEISTELAMQARRGGRAVGALFFAFFGAVWLLIAYQLAHAHSWIPVALVLTAALMLVLAAVTVLRKRRSAMRAVRQSPDSRRMRRQFRAINAVQWITIITAVVLLQKFKLDVWIVPAIMLIVGLHFLPLAHVFRYRPHYVSGAILIVTAMLYPIASPGGPGSPLGSLVAGMTLWSAALWSLRPAER
ncbi:MAG: hypothetical protein ACREUL_01990 [Steroidobacteraceae bacterium]